MSPRFVLMCREIQGVNAGRGESALLLHPITGRKLKTESRGEVRWREMNEDELILNTHTYVEVKDGRYYWKWWALWRVSRQSEI